MVGAEPRGATPASRESSCEGRFRYKVTGSYLTYSKAFILHGDGIFTFLDVSKVVDQRLQLVIVAFLIWKISNRIKKYSKTYINLKEEARNRWRESSNK